MKLLTTRPSDFTGMNVEKITELLVFRCSDSEKDQLIREVRAEEIKTTLFTSCQLLIGSSFTSAHERLV